jgi:hypothetical protein
MNDIILYSIESEDSTKHWPYFSVDNKNVLDLGCGRWHTSDYNELSPIFFAKSASLVVGVDCNPDDIIFYKEKTKGNSKFIFIHQCITNIEQVKELLVTNKITALKCDIEGAEKILLDLTKDDLELVDELAIEFHSEKLKQDFTTNVVEWGFNIKVKANFVNTPDYMGVLFCDKVK